TLPKVTFVMLRWACWANASPISTCASPPTRAAGNSAGRLRTASQNSRSAASSGCAHPGNRGEPAARGGCTCKRRISRLCAASYGPQGGKPYPLLHCNEATNGHGFQGFRAGGGAPRGDRRGAIGERGRRGRVDAARGTQGGDRARRP